MLNKVRKNFSVLVMCFFLIICGSFPLSAQTTSATANAQQNPIINYSLVPTLLMQTVLLSTASSLDNSFVFIPVACEIMILRPSARD